MMTNPRPIATRTDAQGRVRPAWENAPPRKRQSDIRKEQERK